MGFMMIDTYTKKIQTMLRMVGFGDNAGSGFLSLSFEKHVEIKIEGID